MLGSVLGSVPSALPYQTLGYWADTALYWGIDLLIGIAFAAVTYLVGRRWGKQHVGGTVFSAIFYANVLVFLFALFVALTFLAGGVSAWPFLVDADSRGSGSFDVMSNLPGYLAVLTAGSIAFAVWLVVVLVKAIKTVNGFGTAKAFGLAVLASPVSYVAAIPFGM